MRERPLHARLPLNVVARGTRVTAPLLAIGDLVMTRRQLLNLAHLAKRSAKSLIAATGPESTTRA